MPKEDILEGLKLSVQQGHSLQEAMQSFYNAGYAKEDIENAARELISLQNQENYQPQPTQQKSENKKPQKKETAEKNSLNEKPKEKEIHETTGIRKRSITLIIVFSVLTIGIYSIYWAASTTKELRKCTKSAPNPWWLLTLIIPLANFFFMLYYFWKYSKAINELTGFNKVGLFALWVIFSPVAIVLSQIELNKKATENPQKISDYNSNNKKKSGKKWWIILIIIVLAILLLGFGYLAFFVWTW